MLKIFKGTLHVLPLIIDTNALIVCLIARVGLIRQKHTCLSCDKFGYRSRTMFLDQNEVSLFQKSPWNALSGLENTTRPLVFTSGSGCRASENFGIYSEN